MTATKLKPRGKPFTGRDDPRARQNIAAATVGRPADEEVPETTLYEDMMHVRRRPKSEDRTEGQRDCRRWKKQDLRGFMMKFADLEKTYLREQVKKSDMSQSDEEKDTWKDPATLQAERCLAAHMAHQAKEDAEFAARPDAAQLGSSLQSRLQEALRREEIMRERLKELGWGVADVRI